MGVKGLLLEIWIATWFYIILFRRDIILQTIEVLLKSIDNIMGLFRPIRIKNSEQNIGEYISCSKSEIEKLNFVLQLGNNKMSIEKYEPYYRFYKICLNIDEFKELSDWFIERDLEPYY